MLDLVRDMNTDTLEATPSYQISNTWNGLPENLTTMGASHPLIPQGILVLVGLEL